MRPRALDLFCGGGGAARGLIAAGFDVVGVDIRDHARSFPGPFVIGDATRPPFDVSDFDLVWASPPCQAFSAATPTNARERHPDLMDATRSVLRSARRSVIENVPGAPIQRNIVLTGPTVGLPEIERRRIFETRGFWIWQPSLRSRPAPGPPIEVTRKGAKRMVWRDGKWVHGACYVRKEDAVRAMGFDPDCPMTLSELGESVPAAYSELIGRAAIADILRACRRPGRRPGPGG